MQGWAVDADQLSGVRGGVRDQARPSVRRKAAGLPPICCSCSAHPPCDLTCCTRGTAACLPPSCCSCSACRSALIRERLARVKGSQGSALRSANSSSTCRGAGQVHPPTGAHTRLVQVTAAAHCHTSSLRFACQGTACAPLRPGKRRSIFGQHLWHAGQEGGVKGGAPGPSAQSLRRAPRRHLTRRLHPHGRQRLLVRLQHTDARAHTTGQRTSPFLGLSAGRLRHPPSHDLCLGRTWRAILRSRKLMSPSLSLSTWNLT